MDNKNDCCLQNPIVLGFIFFHSNKVDAILALGDPFPRGYVDLFLALLMSRLRSAAR
jgi:hypothetical protein